VPRYIALVIGLVGLAGVAGCGGDRASVPPANTQPKAAVESEVPKSSGEDLPPKDSIPHLPTTSSNELSKNELHEEEPPLSDNAIVNGTINKTRDETAISPERIMLLTPGGPLLMNVGLTIAGRPHTEVFAAIVQRVLDAGDTNGDGRSTWQEWKDNEEFLQGELAAVPAGNSRRVQRWIERYDENDDNQIQPQEAASWLGRNRGGSARAFAIRSRRSFLALPTIHSRVWQLLDNDQDGLLSEIEIQRAPERFWSLDADDDRIITMSELASCGRSNDAI